MNYSFKIWIFLRPSRGRDENKTKHGTHDWWTNKEMIHQVYISLQLNVTSNVEGTLKCIWKPFLTNWDYGSLKVKKLIAKLQCLQREYKMEYQDQDGKTLHKYYLFLYGPSAGRVFLQITSLQAHLASFVL